MQPIISIGGGRIVLFLILAVVISEFVRSRAGVCSVVEGRSMYPTFKQDDVVQSTTPAGDPERGDIVIISDDRGDRIIKRIIGLPGESVALVLGFVYINGQRLSEPYVPRHVYTIRSDKAYSPTNWKLADNQFFVLGDNRLDSDDSRHFGPVERRCIRGVVTLPENTARPEFCDIILSKSGKPMRKSKKPTEESL